MKPHGLSRFDEFVKHVCDKSDDNAGAPERRSNNVHYTFGRLLPEKPITGSSEDYGPFDVNYLIGPYNELVNGNELFKGMKRTADDISHDVAAGMTFFGQFIDHDITLDVTSQIGSFADVENITNVRTPTLDLDSVYLNGPEASAWM